MPPPENNESPWDYRTRKDRLELVESRHFTPQVETLMRGESTNNIAADIAYTLRKFPNHHRALISLVRYAEQKNKLQFPGAKYSVECYLKRAAYFKEDDLQVRIIYASYLAQKNKKSEAISHLEFIESKDENSQIINYNLGLIYFEVKNYEKSLHYAHLVYSQGFPLPGLRNKLTRAGKWKDAPPTVPPSPAEELMEPPENKPNISQNQPL
jgi:tetratricopeptide (TPR) repeat protein